jgi:ABC-type nickel/cobalt efflux system permease component RcnA
MSFQIENAKELQRLIEENGLTIESIDQLHDLLTGLQAKDPEQQKEELAAKERRQACEHAHLERIRTLEHTERLRALELGQPLPDPAAAERGRSAIRAAAGIGIVVSLMLTAAAAGLSAILLLLVASSREVIVFGVVTDLQVALFIVLWGVCGLVTLVTVWACLRTVRKTVQGSAAQQQHFPHLKNSRPLSTTPEGAPQTRAVEG